MLTTEHYHSQQPEGHIMDEESKKVRKPRESNPWQILKQIISHDTDPAMYEDEVLPQSFYSLQSCEAECRKLAFDNHGATFTPVKYGPTFRAEKVESVRVSRG